MCNPSRFNVSVETKSAHHKLWYPFLLSFGMPLSFGLNYEFNCNRLCLSCNLMDFGWVICDVIHNMQTDLYHFRLSNEIIQLCCSWNMFGTADPEETYGDKTRICCIGYCCCLISNGDQIIHTNYIWTDSARNHLKIYYYFGFDLL